MQFRQTGFSLLELIGVMAVMAILAGAMAPNIADSIDRAYRDSERQTLSVLADALRQAVETDKQIPSSKPDSWGRLVARVSQYAYPRIVVNDKGYRRRLIIDPRFIDGASGDFDGYVQKRGLKKRPQSPRIILVSDLDGHAPTRKIDADMFDAIWNQSDDAVLKEGRKLLIERINLSGSFHRIILGNQNSRRSFFRLEDGPAVPVPAAIGGRDGSVTRYVLSNTRLSLYAAPYPSGELEQVTVVQGDTAFRYRSSDSSAVASGGGRSASGKDDDDDDKDKGKKNKKKKKKQRGKSEADSSQWSWVRS